MPETELTEAVKAMVGEAQGLRSEVAALKVYGKRNRHLIWLTGASVILDVVLSLGLAFAIHKGQQATDKAGKASSTTAMVCTALNDQNNVQRKLWETILAFPPAEAETPEQKARRVTFVEYLDKAFAQRDCKKTP
jgi:anthranilate phosphoribosyltransferase